MSTVTANTEEGRISESERSTERNRLISRAEVICDAAHLR